MDASTNFSQYIHASHLLMMQKEIRRWEKDFKQLDDQLFRERDKFLIVKDYRTRRIWTHYGDVKVTRRRYIDSRNGISRYLLDEKLNLSRKKYVMTEYRHEALNSFLSLRSYSQVAKVTFNNELSKQSICNFIKNTNVSEKSSKPFKCDDGILNINVDGIFIKKNGRIERAVERSTKTAASFHIKSFLFFTNSIEQDNGRFQLQNRYMKFFVEETGIQKTNNEIIDNEEWISDELMKVVSLYEGVKEIRLIGDGAKWIKNLAPWLGATYCSDKFHIRKRLKDLVGRNNYSKALKIINQPLHKEIIRKKLLKFVASPLTGEISSEDLKTIGYILNNHKSYLKSMELGVISAIEPIQAHYIARYFKRQRKCWSIKAVKNLIITIQNQFNTT